MNHQLRRDSTETYDGGKYLYRYSIRKSVSDEWTFIQLVYARTIREARTETCLVWRDDD